MRRERFLETDPAASEPPRVCRRPGLWSRRHIDGSRYDRNLIFVAERGVAAHKLLMEQRFSNPTVGLGFVGRPGPSDAKITCSFPMKFGGAPFVIDLHDRLTGRLKCKSSTEVYADLLAAKILPDTPGRTFMTIKDSDGGPAMRFPLPVRPLAAASRRRIEGLDARKEVVGAGQPIKSTQRDDWNPLFVSALEKSSVFLMVITPSYLSSEFCKQEFKQAMRENARRTGGKKEKLRFIALSLGRKEKVEQHEADISKEFPMATVTFVHSSFSDAEANILEKGWIPSRLPEKDFESLIQQIKLTI